MSLDFITIRIWDFKPRVNNTLSISLTDCVHVSLMINIFYIFQGFCTSSPYCQNDAFCFINFNETNCLCRPGYIGSTCAQSKYLFSSAVSCKREIVTPELWYLCGFFFILYLRLLKVGSIAYKLQLIFECYVSFLGGKIQSSYIYKSVRS